ncbi:3-hydroxyacyl-CoA dehydrogenase NAD-binding domain-containing protein [Corynebacterium bovis]|uniref:3-hydroxyacyl-CoA dehydrogenase NAD-binding domain-containing protein n=1 Tax=Corynebacterium bovis TaxID=36808 RepID=UPI003139A897
MSTALIVGAGVIGLSWARLFAGAGWAVRVTDPRDDLADILAEAFPDAPTGGDGAGPDPTAVPGSVTGYADAAEAASAGAGVDFVQEAGPERVEIKQEIFRTLAAATAEGTVLASSSSSLLPSDIAEGNDAASRIIIGHPFNPPELMPLVEIVPSPATSDAAVARAVEVYRSLGRNPVPLRKEIRGFVGNRLQRVFNEQAAYLVQEGVVGPAELDEIVRTSLGLRWATIGPFEGQRLGGGPAGARHLLEHVGAAMDFDSGAPDPARTGEVVDAIEADYGADEESYRRLTAARDARTRAVLAALRSVDS